VEEGWGGQGWLEVSEYLFKVLRTDNSGVCAAAVAGLGEGSWNKVLRGKGP